MNTAKKTAKPAAWTGTIDDYLTAPAATGTATLEPPPVAVAPSVHTSEPAPEAQPPRAARGADIPTAGTRFFTLAEVADTLRITTRTVYNIIKEGRLDTFILGGKNVVTEAELNRYLKWVYDNQSEQGAHKRRK